MADVLIIGMEMPRHCLRCPLRDKGDDHCVLQPESVDTDTWEFQMEHCPIVPLPKKHGRLIDADAFKAMCLSATKEAKPDFIRHEDWLKSCAITTAFCRDIDEQPTIVPAEGGSEE